MLVLGVDFETTGVDPYNDDIIEVGAVLWDVDEHRPLLMVSDLVTTTRNIPPQITEITGIHPEDLKSYGISLDQALERLARAARPASYLVAHNGLKFDKLFLERACGGAGSERYLSSFNRPWIDTLTDLPYPNSITTRKLSYLAAEHGFLNPFRHRALFDVLTMLKVLSNYEFAKVLEAQRSPLVKLVAKVSYEEKSKAKDLGFRWDPNQRYWYMEVRQAIVESKSFPFPVAIV